jgi:hypothetical protein
MFLEASLEVEAGSSAGHVAKFNEFWEKVHAVTKEVNSFYFKPIVSAPDANHVAIGLKLHWKNKLRKGISGEIAGKLAHLEQKMNIKFNLGSSFEEIMDSGKTLIGCANEGFEVVASLTLISNIKKVLLELMKSEEQHQGTILMLTMFTPLFLLKLSGNIHLEFEDMDEIKDHPMAQPMMISFEQLFEGMMGSSVEDIMAMTLDLEGKEGEGAEWESLIAGIKGRDDLMSLVKSMGNNMSIKIAVPDFLVSVQLDINAPGIGKALALGLQATTHPMFERALDDF